MTLLDDLFNFFLCPNKNFVCASCLCIRMCEINLSIILSVVTLSRSHSAAMLVFFAREVQIESHHLIFLQTIITCMYVSR